MPQQLELSMPFAPRYSEHYAQARVANLAWLRAHHMLGSQDATDHYLAWDMADLAARCWPDTHPADLALTVDLKAFYFLFDDQFDGPQGRDPRHVAAACDNLVAIAHQDPDAKTNSPVFSAFSDLWARLREGMSSAWVARTACDWERYFASHPYEALNRRAGVVPAADDYFETRRGVAATESVVDMVERLNRIELPRIVFHSPQIRLMRQIAADVPFLANDVFSYEKEVARGDVYNIVVVLRQAQRCTMQDAVDHVQKMIQDRLDRFSELNRSLPRVYSSLGLDAEDVSTVTKYVRGLGDWIRGHDDWMNETYRYVEPTSSETPGYLEKLLDEPTPSAII